MCEHWVFFFTQFHNFIYLLLCTFNSPITLYSVFDSVAGIYPIPFLRVRRKSYPDYFNDYLIPIINSMNVYEVNNLWLFWWSVFWSISYLRRLYRIDHLIISAIVKYLLDYFWRLSEIEALTDVTVIWCPNPDCFVDDLPSRPLRPVLFSQISGVDSVIYINLFLLTIHLVRSSSIFPAYSVLWPLLAGVIHVKLIQINFLDINCDGLNSYWPGLDKTVGLRVAWTVRQKTANDLINIVLCLYMFVHLFTCITFVFLTFWFVTFWVRV